MAPKIQVIDRDLAEPLPASASPQRTDGRRWILLRGLALFTAAYGSLHKLFIPLALHFTALRSSPYAQVDPGIFLLAPWGLWLWRRRTELGRLGSALSGALIARGAWELWQVSQTPDTGWLAFSHLLSGVPPAVASLGLLTRSERAVFPLWAWLGAGCMAAIVGAQGFFATTPPIADAVAPIASTPRAATPPRALPECGGQAFTVGPATQGERVPSVTLSACGFHPARATLPSGNRLHLVNATDTAFNVHFYRQRAGRLGEGWNLLLPAHSERWSPAMRIEPDAVGLLFSDAHPSAGLTAILPREGTQAWDISRTPLRAEERLSP
jgi:hypothetical protein